MCKATLYMVVPCFNEEQVLPITAPLFLEKLNALISAEKISQESRILFVNDGSRDKTWEIICALSRQDEHFIGISQSRNRGHQNAVYAGLMESKDRCDITVSIDCDGQDDLNAIDKMVEEYLGGAEIVYGVRSDRKTDRPFKRLTAQVFYKLMNALGAEVIYNHADYRLVSSKVLQSFAEYKEVNLFLRGMFPLVGFKSTCVYYERTRRLAGKSKYPLRKMISLALNGITSLSVKPIRLITLLGLMISLVSFGLVIWALVVHFMGLTVRGWASMTALICFFGGIQLLSLGIVGEYIGKIYLETKGRPKYIISDRTEKE